MQATRVLGWLAAAVLALGPASAPAQVRSVDPNDAIAADVTPPSEQQAPPADVREPLPAQESPPPAYPPAGYPPTAPAPVAPRGTTYHRDDLIGAAEGVFGRGAQGLAGIIEKILKDQGEPSAYIAGREAAGAFVVGLRYGSGTLSHRVEGERPVYWTGPSIGFDAGGDATKVFVLVYNLYDTQELYRRFPQVEGRAYFVGGFSATYLRRGHTVLIPVRLGVGLRLGANLGYMKFSEKHKWLPF